MAEHRKRRPLPRREFSVRSDYQALLGRHRITVTHNGCIQEEDSLKLALKANNEQAETGAMLTREAGISRYERITGYDFNAGDLYWEKQSLFGVMSGRTGLRSTSLPKHSK